MNLNNLFIHSRPRRRHQEDRRRALLQRIESNRSQLESLMRRHQESDPGFSARARSLLLLLQGRRLDEIARITGLSLNTIMRVRSRFEHWGLACIAEPQPVMAGRH